MYVCICNNVTESDIDRAISAGARSLSCVKQELGVASCCGQCEERAAEYVDAAVPKNTNDMMKIRQVTTQAITHALNDGATVAGTAWSNQNATAPA